GQSKSSNYRIDPALPLAWRGKLAWPVSVRRSCHRRALEEGPSFRLEDCNEVEGVDVPLVLTAFPLIALPGKLIDAGLRHGIETQVEKLLRDLRSEDTVEGSSNRSRTGASRVLVGVLYPGSRPSI